ncbi:MAG TPA: hypothetical protein VIK74_11635 [Parasegetibacter sp.]
MTRIAPLLLLAVFLISAVMVQGQRKVSEMTVTYTASISSDNKEPAISDAFDGATTTVYLKGSLSRTEMVSTLATFVTIHDAKNGTAVSLRETSGQKLLIRMNADDWKDRNKRYDGITFTDTNETKKIAGYNCIKSVAKLSDGTTFTVYYTPDIIPENRDYDYQFRTLPGFPLEYELEMGSYHVKYTATQVNFSPVPASRFDIPKSGYREMTYEESNKLRGVKQ